MTLDAVTRFDHDAWRAAAGTAVSYLLVLGLMFVLLFVVPWLAFTAL